MGSYGTTTANCYSWFDLLTKAVTIFLIAFMIIGIIQLDHTKNLCKGNRKNKTYIKAPKIEKDKIDLQTTIFKYIWNSSETQKAVNTIRWYDTINNQYFITLEAYNYTIIAPFRRNWDFLYILRKNSIIADLNSTETEDFVRYLDRCIAQRICKNIPGYGCLILNYGNIKICDIQNVVNKVVFINSKELDYDFILEIVREHRLRLM